MEELLSLALGMQNKLSYFNFDHPVDFVYAPLDYAWGGYKSYITNFAPQKARGLFIGMNPGPFGMAQTGIPFGDVVMVREWMEISCEINTPEKYHANRPITGFNCTRREVSGSRLWQIKKKNECNIISEIMKGQKIYIADGHHRYHTMLSFRDEMRRKFPEAGPSAPWEFILMFLTNIEQPGLTVLPTHRILNNINTLGVEDFERRLSKFFSLEKYYFTQTDQAEVLKVWIKDLKETGAKHKLGIFNRKINCYYVVTLNNITGYEKLILDKGSGISKSLDVNILNVLILNEILGIDESQLNEGKVIQYTNEIKVGLSEVTKGNAELAFFLNPTKISEVIKVSNNRELMPRKSTHFHPKPISGLLFYPMDQ